MAFCSANYKLHYVVFKVVKEGVSEVKPGRCMVKPGSSQRKKSTCTEPSTGFSVLSPGRLSSSSLHWAELEPDT